MPKKIPMAALLLAGGKSSRMGQDKALLNFGEDTFLEFLSGVLTSIFSQTLVVVDKKEKCKGLDLKGAVAVEDILRNRGPLAGIYTGLSYSKHQASCVFTCDMPFVDETLIRELAGFWQADYDVVCLEDAGGRLQPFPGIYLRSSRHLIHLLLERKEASMARFLAVAAVKPLVLQRKKIRVLTNMNTIEDYYQVLREKRERVRE